MELPREEDEGECGMSKEVEAAVKRIRNTIAYLGRKSGKTRYFEDINLIIEQTEQFQELEDRHYRQELIDEHIERLEKQNKRYREAIKKSATIIKSLPRTSGKTKLYNTLIKALEDDSV